MSELQSDQYVQGFRPLFLDPPSRSKGFLARIFNSKAMSFVTGAAVSAAVKITAGSLLVAGGAPVLIASVAAAALAGGVRGALAYNRLRTEAIETEKKVPEWKDSGRLVGTHIALAAVGGFAFSAFGDEIANWFGSLFHAATGTSDALINASLPETTMSGSPASSPVPESANMDITKAPAENMLSAQQIKDQAFCEFNGKCGTGLDRTHAASLFQQADALGDASAGIDVAYLEYHGLGGMEKSPAHAIEKMQQVLEKMQGAGKAGSAGYQRGQALLTQWMDVEYAETGVDALLNDAQEHTLSVLEEEEASAFTQQVLQSELAAPALR